MTKNQTAIVAILIVAVAVWYLYQKSTLAKKLDIGLATDTTDTNQLGPLG